MKTLKITLTLVAVVLLTVSGVQSENVAKEQPTYETESNYDLLAINKKKKATQQQG